MDPFKEVMKISAITILFGLLSLVIGWFSVIIIDSFLMIQLREIAIVLLVLFFYSLTMDKVDEIEQKIRIVSSGRKKRVNLVP
jgi:putative Mn2+ efflux pump MntP